MEEEGSRENRGASSEDFGVSAPQITLPKGGGAIQGIGEKFAANPVTGTGSMSVPIATSPGRAGFGPELSLSYDSGAGNGIFGFGWNHPCHPLPAKLIKACLVIRMDSLQTSLYFRCGRSCTKD